ncbi:MULTISPECIES: hypothetical protein [Streptomyces]|uniref:Uncharacterized protein n=1 Tax=Streptomyces ochraceiscleroticus TaxID=47761 RepID=A0ABW1MID1_9ACTN|nr:MULTISPECIES: hypothetical protein [Streptomyces]
MTDEVGTEAVPDGSEEWLRRALDDVASSVSAPPQAYRKGQADWRRRAVRRKALLGILVLTVVAVACAIGLLVLSCGSASTHVIYDDAGTGTVVVPFPPASS